MIRSVLISLVKGYRLLLSPWLGSGCRFTPTCSAYSLEAFERHGATVGTYLTLARLLRCHPWCEGGHDPVPQKGAFDQRLALLAQLFRSPSKKKPS